MGNNAITNIEGRILGGVSAGLYRQAPWHGTGDVVDAKGRTLGVKRPLRDDVRDPYTISVLADLDWEPREIGLDGATVNGCTLSSAQKILVRDGWPEQGLSFDLGVHSDKYGLLSNEMGLAFVGEILRHRSDAILRSVTTLYGGKIIFAVIEFRDLVQVTRRNGEAKDSHTQFMGVYWSHDGSHPLGVKFMRHEWVCENTFTPWNAETGLVVRHTRHANDRASDALRAIEGMMLAQDEFDKEIERLLTIEVSDRDFKSTVVKGLIGQRPEPKVTLTKTGVGSSDRSGINWDQAFQAMCDEWREYTDQSTGFDAVMAVQGFEQHRQTVRGGGRDVKTITRLLRDSYPLTAKAAQLVG